jgi:hypothetical protein
MTITIQVQASISNINQNDWQRLTDDNSPFLDYGFLAALEQSGSLHNRTGWYPVYLTAHQNQQLVGVLPLYIKTNSYGEFIFDWQWAEAYEQLGMDYYPKLVSAIPFTPVNSSKILVDNTIGSRADIAHALIQAARQVMSERNMSSLHALFLAPEEAPIWEDHGFKIRHSYQYHWFNQDYRDFDHFLGSLKGKRRRQIQRERQQVKAQNLRIRILTGEQLHETLAEDFYPFYMATIDKKFGLPYLTKSFFQLVFRNFKKHTLLVLAADETGEYVAGSIAFTKGHNLYGRYWGARENFRNLHFELCYYQLIDYAIRNRLKRFEAGAQGRHKIHRGFQPVRILSGHTIQHPQLEEAIFRYIDEEKHVVAEGLREDTEHLPFRPATDPL